MTRKQPPVPSKRATDRTGFLRGAFTVPSDFDTMDREIIQALFEGADEESADGSDPPTEK